MGFKVAAPHGSNFRRLGSTVVGAQKATLGKDMSAERGQVWVLGNGGRKD